MNTFTATWTDKLQTAVATAAAALNHPYVITCPTQGEDYKAITAAVNQGIDAHLEACFVPARGDRFVHAGSRLECSLSAQSLPVLVRRLLESDSEPANLIAISICQTLDIELI